MARWQSIDAVRNRVVDFYILEDRGGRIWASTRDGVIRSGGSKGHFEHLAELRRPPDTAWNVLALDKTGAVWAVTTDGLYQSRQDTFECVARSGGAYGQIFR